MALAKRICAYAVLSIIIKAHIREMKHETTWPNRGALNVTFLLKLCVCRPSGLTVDNNQWYNQGFVRVSYY